MSDREFDLEKRTLEFAKRVIRLCKALSKDAINNKIIDQLVRASGSVGANYREANDALSKKDFLHRLRISRKEAKESQYWLQLTNEANPNEREEINELEKEAIEIKKILSAIITKSE